MKKEDVKKYIGQLLNIPKIDKEEVEIPNVILLLVVYMAGLQKKPFPLDMVGNEDALDIEKELPVIFHTLVAQLSIKKSKIEQRTRDMRVSEYLIRESHKLLEEFRSYFLATENK